MLGRWRKPESSPPVRIPTIEDARAALPPAGHTIKSEYNDHCQECNTSARAAESCPLVSHGWNNQHLATVIHDLLNRLEQANARGGEMLWGDTQLLPGAGLSWYRLENDKSSVEAELNEAYAQAAAKAGLSGKHPCRDLHHSKRCPRDHTNQVCAIVRKRLSGDELVGFARAKLESLHERARNAEKAFRASVAAAVALSVEYEYAASIAEASMEASLGQMHDPEILAITDLDMRMKDKAEMVRAQNELYIQYGQLSRPPQ